MFTSFSPAQHHRTAVIDDFTNRIEDAVTLTVHRLSSPASHAPWHYLNGMIFLVRLAVSALLPFLCTSEPLSCNRADFVRSLCLDGVASLAHSGNVCVYKLGPT